MSNIYQSGVRAHFRCGHDVSRDMQLQLTIRAIEGLDINSLSEQEKEHAAKAIEQGYLYREGNAVYTKILVNKMDEESKLFDLSNGLRNGYFETEAEIVAEKLAELIKNALPEYLWGEWMYANTLANLPVLETVVEHLIEKGVLTPPENGIGAEGCWMSVRK